MHLYECNLLFLLFFVYLNIISSEEDINVGTVLFTKEDLNKKCWNDEQIALLHARFIYQNILPKTTLVDVKNDEFLNEMLNYFNLAIDQVKCLTSGETRRINLMAMCDVLGGYLRSIFIPLTKHAFYFGSIHYETAEQVEKFYDDIKLFLRTDGKNWAAPSDSITRRFARDAAPELPATNKCTHENNEESCDQIIYTNNNGFIFIPYPYFDSNTNPTAIAIPFKENPLRNMDEKNAIYCISNFYATARKCLQQKNASNENVKKFNLGFEYFLDKNVYPHLTDEKIYPAFGGVFQIKNEITYKAPCPEIIGKIRKKRMADVRKKIKHINPEFFERNDVNLIIAIVCLSAIIIIWTCITIYYCSSCRRKNVAINTTQNTGTTIDPVYQYNRKEAAEKPAAAVKHKQNQCCINRTNLKQQYGLKSSRKPCPKCKKKHCRCFNHIWSDLSNCTITYPRIFSQKNTATSTLLQKHLEFKSNNQTVVSLCPQCKIPGCKHLNKFAVDKSERDSRPQNQFMVDKASHIPKRYVRNIRSAPVTAGNVILQSEYSYKSTIASRKVESNERIVVFGYDFETSGDSSSSDESSTDSS